MNDQHVGLGPALADRIGGKFDLDNASIRFRESTGITGFVRCGVTGKVQYVPDGVSPPVLLGTMSDGIEALALAFYEATGS